MSGTASPRRADAADDGVSDNGVADDGLSTWMATRLVARREFIERVRDRGFLVSTGFTLAILLGVLLIPKLFNSDSVATVGFTRSQEFTGQVYSDMVSSTQRLSQLTGV